MTAPTSRNPALVQSLSRGLRILEWLSDEEEGLALAEVAARLGVSRSTAFNLLHTLMRHGFARKTSRPARYRLGAAPRDLVERARTRSGGQRLEEAFRALGETLQDCFLFYCENTGGDFRMILRRDPATPPGFFDRDPVCRRVIPYVMALSRAYLAFCDREDRAAYRQAYPFEEYGLHLWPDYAAFEQSLDAARREGVLIVTGPPCRVVVPLFRAGGDLSGLLCASHPGDAAEPAPADTTAPRLRGALLETAARIGAPAPGTSLFPGVSS